MKTVYIFLITILTLFWSTPSLAQTTTIEELQMQILKLQAQIEKLEKQLTELQLKSESWCRDFKVNLKFKEAGEEIRALQIALEKEGLFKKSVTGYFGPYTFQAVQSFQEKYQKDILFPQKLKRGTGFFGPASRSKLNELYGCTKVYLSSRSPQPGDTLLIKIESRSPIGKVSGKLNSQKINFFKLGGSWVGIFGISVKERVGKHNLTIYFDNGEILKKELKTIKREFPIRRLLVTKELREKGFTPSKIKENVAKENQKISQALQIFTPNPYFSQSFIYPLKEIKVAGGFGDIRKSGKITLQHLGVDLLAEIGTPVFAINDGLIRFSEELANYGKTIIIDHGMGIFSLYLHLDEFKVFAGKEIKRGEIIALSGNTGYSIAPHLHFSVKINGLSVDPLRFIATIEKEML